MTALLALGVALGLDSFRVSLGLGTLPLRWARRLSIALAFGLCDALALLAGSALGGAFVNLLSQPAEYLGPVVLGSYGLYLIYLARYRADSARADDKSWMLFGLPVVLSLDNLIAGIGVGLLGFSVITSTAVIALMSALMSLAGLQLGGALARRVPLPSELVGGLMLVLLAVALSFSLFTPT